MAIAVAGLAAPAGAAGLAVPGKPEVKSVRGEYGASVAEDEKFRAATRPERPRGPFHPVVGEPDYGDSGAVYGAGRSGHSHEGQDVFATTGTPLVAVADGTVVETGNDGGRGNFVNLYDPKRDQTYVYMHMVEPSSFATGDEVRAGEQVGAVGCTGSCYGEHLHFEIRDGQDGYGASRDPLADLQSWKSLSEPLR